MVGVEQRFRSDRIDDIQTTVRAQLASTLHGKSLAAKSIAITAGSRGIARISEIVAAIVAQLKDWGARPFIVPAMGSHGGATVEGQLKVLEHYGVTEAAVGAPIRASMETVIAARLKNGAPVHFDRYASEADGIVVCGRVKPHTDFRGDYESGLFKMLAIGLGKHAGATTLHQFGFSEFPWLIPEAGRALIDAMPVLVGLAIVENAYHEPMIVEAVRPDDFEAREKALLATAKQSIARLMMPKIDLLIVDELGKNISGSGMDPNVTGRGVENFMKALDGGAPQIKRLLVRNLTRESDGNATGIGFADLTTLRCVETIDFGTTYTNTITSTELAGSKLPVVCNSDREAIVVGLRTSRCEAPAEARVVWIRNTNELTHIRVSKAVLDDVAGRDDIHILGSAEPFAFDSSDYLVSGA
jgi:hypothetical protein